METGSLGLMDWLLGTDGEFRKWQAAQHVQAAAVKKFSISKAA